MIGRTRGLKRVGCSRFPRPARIVVAAAGALLLAWPTPSTASLRYSREKGWSYRAPKRPERAHKARRMRRTPAEQYAYARSFADRGRYGMAIFQYRSLLNHVKRGNYPPTPYAGLAQLGIADAYMAAGKLSRAADEYNTALVEYSRFFTGRQIEKARSNLLAIGDYYFNLKRGRVRDALGQNHYERAAEVYTYYITNAPYSAQAPRVQYLIGEGYFKRKDYMNACEEYRKVIDNYPQSQWRDDALYQLGVALEKRTRPAIYDQTLTDEALEAFRTFVRDFPDDPRVPDARDAIRRLEDLRAESLYIIARWYRKQRKWDGVRLYYQQVVADYPTTRWAELAERQLAGLEALQ